jgi:AAA+ superfamily predicted ATPase
MSQNDYIKDLAVYSLENNQELLQQTLRELIDYSHKTKRTNLAIQLQSILQDGIRKQNLAGIKAVGSSSYYTAQEEKALDDLVLEKITSDYTMKDLICSKEVRSNLSYFLDEQRKVDLLNNLELPVSNKLLLYGPSGCGKTLTSYIISGELKRVMYVINLGAIVSSKLGETSKNLSLLFKRAASEDSIIFLDEFDSIGKVRDYDHDHGEMKRVVNTLLQLFDFLPKKTIVIAATNQIQMIDPALRRRFDLTLELDIPNEESVHALINHILSGTNFTFDNRDRVRSIEKKCVELSLSYYIIQKTLITAIKRSVLNMGQDILPKDIQIETSVWERLVEQEKQG